MTTTLNKLIKIDSKKKGLHDGEMISLTELANIHLWLRCHYGKANMCADKNCIGRSKRFHYAKKHGFKYEKNRENYIMLCASCHKKYDMTDEIRKKQSLAKRKKVAQYDLKGNFIRIWNSQNEVSEFYGVNKSDIANCVAGRYSNACGYKFIRVQL